MKLKILAAIVITLLPIVILISPSSLMKGLGIVEWKLLSGQSVNLYKNDDYAKALLVAKHSLKVAEEKINPNGIRVAKSLNNLGLIYDGLKQFKKADAAFGRSDEIKKKLLGADNPSMIRSFRNRADHFLAKGDYAQAIALNNRALEIQKNKYDSDSLQVAKTLNKLGETYIKKKDYDKAEDYLKQALTIRKKKLGLNHSSVATSLNNLGALYHYKGDYEKAESFHKRSLAIRKETEGLKSSAVKKSLHNLSEAYMKLEKFSDAITVKEQLLLLIKKSKEPDYVSESTLLHDLGWLYYRQGNFHKENRAESYKKAESYYLQALAIREKKLKPDHPKLQSTLVNLASLYRKTNQLSKAKNIEKRIKDKESDKKNNDELVAHFIPSLSSTLLAAEKKKGSPLTKEEVISIRDNSQTIMMPKKMIKALAKKRGYDDIDPENCWEEWLLLKPSLGLGSNTDKSALILDNPSGDPKMKHAEIKAQKTLTEFRQLIKQHSGYSALIKTKIIDTDTSARMWLIVDKDNKEGFEAHLFEVPSDFTKHKKDESFTLKDEDILDWMLNVDGNTYGAYTIRVQRESMDEDEKQKIDEYMGIKKYL